MKKKWFKGIATAIALTMTLTACGSPSATPDKKEETAKSSSSIEEKYPGLIENEGEAVDGGTLKVGLVSDSPFKGIFNGYLYTDNTDNVIMKYTMDGAFPIDADFKLIADSDETPIKLNIDKEAKTVSYTINSGKPTIYNGR